MVNSGKAFGFLRPTKSIRLFLFLSGIDEDEESDDATLDLRRHAVMAYIGLLDKPVIPDILIQLACWVVGEYFDLIEDYTADDVVALLYKVLLRKFHGRWLIYI